MILTFLITAGPTREFIDPVRYISNASSGKMGCSLAMAAHHLGHKVILISGPGEIKPGSGIKRIDVISAAEMFKQVKKYIKKADIFISSAAVADYRPRKSAKKKIKKNSPYITIELVRNPDILGYAGSVKNKQVIVGFALESENLLNYAKEKLLKKNLDLIVANSTSVIGKDKTSVMILKNDCQPLFVKNKSKDNIAEIIINETVRIWESSQASEKQSDRNAGNGRK